LWDAGVLELRSQGDGDVQRVQHGSLLRIVLPTQGLGDAPQDLRQRGSGRRPQDGDDSRASPVHRHGTEPARADEAGDERRRRDGGGGEPS